MVASNGKDDLTEEVIDAVATYYNQEGRKDKASVRHMGEFVSFLMDTLGMPAWNFWIAADQALTYTGNDKYA